MESFTWKCTGGTPHILHYGIDFTCWREVSRGTKKFCRRRRNWRVLKDTLVLDGPRWLGRRVEIAPLQSDPYLSGNNRILFSMPSYVFKRNRVGGALNGTEMWFLSQLN